MGYSVIPCNPSEEEEKGKKPFIKWERYQKERAAPEQIKEWWAKWPAAMIGIVTGEISGIFVVDADSEAAKEKIEELLPENFEGPMVKTPRPGYHYYFANHKGILNSNNGVFHVRGSGGFVIAPPSKRSNGLTYSWQIPLQPPVHSSGPSPPSSSPWPTFRLPFFSGPRRLRSRSYRSRQRTSGKGPHVESFRKRQLRHLR